MCAPRTISKTTVAKQSWADAGGAHHVSIPPQYFGRNFSKSDLVVETPRGGAPGTCLSDNEFSNTQTRGIATSRSVSLSPSCLILVVPIMKRKRILVINAFE